MGLGDLVQRTWESLRVWTAPFTLAATMAFASYAMIYNKPPEEPDWKLYALDLERGLFPNVNFTQKYPFRVRIGEDEFPYRTSALSPDRRHLAVTVRKGDNWPILIVQKDGTYSELPHEYSRRPSILGWKDNNTIRISEFDVYEKNIHDGSVRYLTHGARDYVFALNNKLVVGIGLYGFCTLMLLPSIFYSRKFLRKPECISDILVAYPASAGVLAGAYAAWDYYVSVENSGIPILEGVKNTSHIFNAVQCIGFGAMMHYTLSFFHAAKSPMIPNFFRILKNSFKDDNEKAAELAGNENVRLYFDKMSALQKKDIEGAFTIEEKRLSIPYRPVILVDLMGSAFTLSYLRHSKKRMRDFGPANHVQMVEAYMTAGKLSKAVRTAEEMFKMSTDVWDEGLLLAGLRLAYEDHPSVTALWMRLQKRLRNKYGFEDTNSRNQVLRLKGSGLMRDTVLFEEYGLDQSAAKWFNSQLVYAQYGSKYEVTKPVIQFKDVSRTYVYQITQANSCIHLPSILGRLQEFHSRMDAYSDKVPSLDYHDAYYTWCFKRVPPSLKKYATPVYNLAEPLINDLSKLDTTFIHGDFTKNNFGECIDHSGNKHICMWDFEQCCRAPPSLDVARFGMHSYGSLKRVIENCSYEGEHILLNCMFDGAKLLAGCYARNGEGDKDSAKKYARRLLSASDLLGRHKGFAMCWSEMAHEWAG